MITFLLIVVAIQLGILLANIRTLNNNVNVIGKALTVGNEQIYKVLVEIQKNTSKGK